MNKKMIAILTVLMLTLIVFSVPVLAADEVKVKDWEGAFAQKSRDAFAASLAEDIVLEAPTMYYPAVGRHNVQRIMETASKYYTKCDFITRNTIGLKQYLEWEVRTLDGIEASGNTIITRNEEGKIKHIAISHRPLGKALLFSAGMRQRLLDAGYTDLADFYYRLKD